MRVVITREVPADLVAQELGDHEVLQGPAGVGFDDAALRAVLPRADALVTWGFVRVDATILDLAPRLRIVANIAAGTDNLDLAELERRAVWATNVPDAFATPTAEVAMALMLAVMRRVSEGERFVRSGAWHASEPGRFDGFTLEGKQLGLVGFGRIARAVARRAGAFGMHVVYHARSEAPADVARSLAAEGMPLDSLLASSDVVSLHVPLTPATHHLIGAKELARMKPGAVLINTARGKVVDEVALVAALEAGRLGGAGLDVFHEEPSVPEALLELPNVTVTPHLGGATREARREAQRHALRNVRAVLEGNAPLSPLHRLGDASEGGS